MGTVYLVEQRFRTHARRVAVKVLGLVPSLENRLRLEQEGEVLGLLEHPGIARLIEIGQTDNGMPFIAIEYVEGERIDDLDLPRFGGHRKRDYGPLETTDGETKTVHRRV